MTSYKILKQVDGLEAVLNRARIEAKMCFSKRSTVEVKEKHYQRLETVCETLETLGIVDNCRRLSDDLYHEAWEESKNASRRTSSTGGMSHERQHEKEDIK